MNAQNYLNSLGLDVTAPSRAAVGRLLLAGEFILDGQPGVLLRPTRGQVSNRYLEVLARECYAFVVVDTAGYPSFYAREENEFAPVRALPVAQPELFPSKEVLDAWARLIRAAASRGEPARVGVAQLMAWLEDTSLPRSVTVRSDRVVSVEPLDGDGAAGVEPLRTAAALLAGFRSQPESTDEVLRLLVALSSLLPNSGEASGLTEALAPLVQVRGLGARRLLVSGGFGAEVAALLAAGGMIVLPNEVRALEPLLERLLPSIECVFTDFLQLNFERIYDGVVVVPPLGLQLSGAQLGRFELAKREGKSRSRVPAELLFVEHALAAMADGAVLVAVLPEGLLSSAGHAEFREWLLEHARLLAVVSLPAGTCFRDTGVKCSVVLLRKPADDDYPILMVDVEADDLSGDIEAARSKLEELFEGEGATCA
jgi:hypothetical protein